VETASKTLDESRDTDSIFLVKSLKYGGYEVLIKEAIDYPARHICDFRTEYEARMWIIEHQPKTTAQH
jgi:hypothetical protein